MKTPYHVTYATCLDESVSKTDLCHHLRFDISKLVELYRFYGAGVRIRSKKDREFHIKFRNKITDFFVRIVDIYQPLTNPTLTDVLCSPHNTTLTSKPYHIVYKDYAHESKFKTNISGIFYVDLDKLTEMYIAYGAGSNTKTNKDWDLLEKIGVRAIDMFSRFIDTYQPITSPTFPHTTHVPENRTVES
jgi:hypothetical protein